MARPTRRRRGPPRRAFLSLLAPTALICLTALAAVLLTSRTAAPDLFDLVPKTPQSDGYALLAWPDLERARHALSAGAPASGLRLRALGYMMPDGQTQENAPTASFLLLPDAGDAMHSGDRFGDRMIEVRLQPGQEVRFAERSLVWAWGTLRALPGNPDGEQPLYLIESARCRPAGPNDIPKYFR